MKIEFVTLAYYLFGTEQRSCTGGSIGERYALVLNTLKFHIEK